VSSGPRAALRRAAEHGTTHRGVVPGDDTAQSAGLPTAITDNPGPVSIATGTGLSAAPAQQGLHRDVDPAAASSTTIHRQRPGSSRQVPCSFLNLSGAGNHQGQTSPNRRRRQEQTPVAGPVTHPY
jgi:hypothetical protein